MIIKIVLLKTSIYGVMIYPGCGWQHVATKLPSTLYVLKFILHCLAPA